MTKPVKRSEAEYDYLIRRNAEIAHTLRSGIGNISRYGIYLWGTWLVAKYSYLSINSLSGSNTYADIVVRIIGALRADILISWTVSGAALYLWNREKNLRRRLERRNSLLENEYQQVKKIPRELEKKQDEELDMLPK